MNIRYVIKNLVKLLVFCLWWQAASVQGADILASIRPLALIAQEIGGERVSVETLVNQHQDPHSFALRPSDMLKLSQAGVVLWAGPDLERFLVKPLQGRTSIELARLFDSENHIDSEESTASLGDKKEAEDCHTHGDHQNCSQSDAHFWLSPLNVKIVMQTVAAYLVNQQPLHADYFNQRLTRAQVHLDAQYVLLAKRLAPYKQYSFGSAHDAYANFTDVFGLQQKLAISALPEQRLSLKRLIMVDRELKGSRCLLIERGDASGHRLAKRLALRAVETDILAGSDQINNIYDFFNELGKSFENCLSYAPSN